MSEIMVPCLLLHIFVMFLLLYKTDVFFVLNSAMLLM